jgi:hypothetical protein
MQIWYGSCSGIKMSIALNSRLNKNLLKQVILYALSKTSLKNVIDLSFYSVKKKPRGVSKKS